MDIHVPALQQYSGTLHTACQALKGPVNTGTERPPPAILSTCPGLPYLTFLDRSQSSTDSGHPARCTDPDKG